MRTDCGLGAFRLVYVDCPFITAWNIVLLFGDCAVDGMTFISSRCSRWMRCLVRTRADPRYGRLVRGDGATLTVRALLLLLICCCWLLLNGGFCSFTFERALCNCLMHCGVGIVVLTLLRGRLVRCVDVDMLLLWYCYDGEHICYCLLLIVMTAIDGGWHYDVWWLYLLWLYCVLQWRGRCWFVTIVFIAAIILMVRTVVIGALSIMMTGGSGNVRQWAVVIPWWWYMTVGRYWTVGYIIITDGRGYYRDAIVDRWRGDWWPVIDYCYPLVLVFYYVALWPLLRYTDDGVIVHWCTDYYRYWWYFLQYSPWWLLPWAIDCCGWLLWWYPLLAIVVVVVPDSGRWRFGGWWSVVVLAIIVVDDSCCLLPVLRYCHWRPLRWRPCPVTGIAVLAHIVVVAWHCHYCYCWPCSAVTVTWHCCLVRAELPLNDLIVAVCWLFVALMLLLFCCALLRVVTGAGERWRCWAFLPWRFALPGAGGCRYVGDGERVLMTYVVIGCVGAVNPNPLHVNLQWLNPPWLRCSFGLPISPRWFVRIQLLPDPGSFHRYSFVVVGRWYCGWLVMMMHWYSYCSVGIVRVFIVMADILWSLGFWNGTVGWTTRLGAV